MANSAVVDKSIARAERQAAKRAAARRRGNGRVVALIVALVIIGAFVAAMVFDVFGFREDIMFPALRNVPLVQTWIPEGYVDYYYEPTDYVAMYYYLQERIERLERQNTHIANELAASNARNEDNTREITRLRTIEQQQLTHNANVEAHERMLAENDPQAFAHFFETINPEHAAEIYADILGINHRTTTWRNHVSMWQAFTPSNAARYIQLNFNIDFDRIIDILYSLDERSRTRIIQALDDEYAAIIVRHIPDGSTP
ncbi:MAG: hypothetical protein FWB71_07170 [Defluviitaleaceae bacterium]|nr:hypothetical protein [Defluviitaleaceae bacterium]